MLLTMLLLTMSVGAWLLFPLLQGYYRYQAHQTIDSQPTKLVRLRVHSSKFKRVDDHEIEYKGLRYDIKSKQIKDQIHEFIAYPDHAETQLLAFFEETWKGITDSTASHSPVSMLVKKMMALDMLLSNTHLPLSIEHSSLPDADFLFISSYSFSFSSCIDLPPEA